MERFIRAKEEYAAAKTKVEDAYASLNEAAAILYKELLMLKELKVEDTCVITDKSGKTVKGVFRIINLSDGSAALRFFPYKKDAQLASLPKVFNFGTLPSISWESSEVKAVSKCSPPEPPTEEQN